MIHALHGEQDLRQMGGLKKDLPITYWTFLIGALAIAGVPGLAGFFSKDEILWQTFDSGHTMLWVIGMLTALLTATYMFRLVFLAFQASAAQLRAGARRHGARPRRRTRRHAPRARAHARAHGHLHDAPPAMALALIVLAIGSVVAGYVGVPAALGGSNRIEHFLRPELRRHGVGGAPRADRASAARGSDSVGRGGARAAEATAEADHDEPTRPPGMPTRSPSSSP